MAPLLYVHLVGCVILASMGRLCTADIIAYHTMNTTDQWNFTTPQIPNILTAANNASSVCPQNKLYCWEITNSLDARLVIPTSDYFRIISFIFSASITDIHRSDTCSVQYTLNTNPSNWHSIASYDNTTNTPFTTTTTFTNWRQAAYQLNTSDITIRILSTGNEHRCYFNDFTLNGHLKSLLSNSRITNNNFVANESWKYLNDTLVCSNNMDCSLHCSSSSTIENSCTHTSLHCPSDTGTACNIICDGGDSCSQLHIIPNNTTLVQSTVLCDSASECRGPGTTVICPPHAPCDIVCSGSSSCRSARILCPSDAPCTVSCGDSGCDSAEIVCPEHAPCDISCYGGQNACSGAIIHCPIDAQCNVSCAGENSCFYAEIIWPVVAESSLSCANGNTYACWGVPFPPVAANTPLKVDCSGWGNCWESIIQCPSNASCDVTCSSSSGAAECAWGTILWPSTPGLGSLQCGPGYDGCAWLMFPTPDPDVPINITCRGSSTCQDSFIKCPSNADCSVRCPSGGCPRATILWPTDPAANTELLFPGANTTPLPTFHASENNDTDLVLNCIAVSQCAGFVVDCPLNARCMISCMNDYACQGMQILWADGQENDLQCGAYNQVCSGVHFQPYDENMSFSQICSGDDACYGAVFDCPSNADCVIECVGHCRHAVIHGPIGHVLTVVCHPGNWRNCHGLIIHAEECLFFNLNATDSDSFAGATVFLPPNDGGTPRTQMYIHPDLNHLNTWYARNGWKDVNVVYLMTPSAVIGTMHCGDAYEQTCAIAMDGLSCRAGFDVCRFLTADPTQEPTVDPIREPRLQVSVANLTLEIIVSVDIQDITKVINQTISEYILRLSVDYTYTLQVDVISTIQDDDTVAVAIHILIISSYDIPIIDGDIMNLIREGVVTISPPVTTMSPPETPGKDTVLEYILEYANVVGVICGVILICLCGAAFLRCFNSRKRISSADVKHLEKERQPGARDDRDVYQVKTSDDIEMAAKPDDDQSISDDSEALYVGSEGRANVVTSAVQSNTTPHDAPRFVVGADDEAEEEEECGETDGYDTDGTDETAEDLYDNALCEEDPNGATALGTTKGATNGATTA